MIETDQLRLSSKYKKVKNLFLNKNHSTTSGEMNFFIYEHLTSMDTDVLT